MKKLITLNETVEVLEGLVSRKQISRTMAFKMLLEEKRFLDQPLTKEMFDGDKAVFVGFKREMQHIFYNPINRIRIIFFADGVGFEYRNKKGYEDDTNFESPTLHDLAELIKANQLEYTTIETTNNELATLD